MEANGDHKGQRHTTGVLEQTLAEDPLTVAFNGILDNSETNQKLSNQGHPIRNGFSVMEAKGDHKGQRHTTGVLEQTLAEDPLTVALNGILDNSETNQKLSN